jgi:peptidoglycan hydrolase FlgJ
MASPTGFDSHVSSVLSTAATQLTASGKLSTAGRLNPAGKLMPSVSDRAHAQAVDFEANFLNSMFEEMFTDIKGDGPLGDAQGIGVWRSFLTGEMSKKIAKAGGVGIAAQVYKSLMAHQEAQQARQAQQAQGIKASAQTQ